MTDDFIKLRQRVSELRAVPVTRSVVKGIASDGSHVQLAMITRQGRAHTPECLGANGVCACGAQIPEVIVSIEHGTLSQHPLNSFVQILDVRTLSIAEARELLKGS